MMATLTITFCWQNYYGRSPRHPQGGRKRAAMESDEEYVRAAWKRVQYRETGLTGDGPCYVVISADDHPTAGSTIFMKHGQDKETVFAAARAYTEERKRQIRLI